MENDLISENQILIEEKQKILNQIVQIVYWKKKRLDFTKSKQFKYVEQFIKIFGYKSSLRDILNLQLSLKHHNLDFPINQLVNQLDFLLNEVEENPHYESVEDSNERFRILNQINFDKAISLEDCRYSYLKITEEENINEKSLKNLARVLKIKRFEKKEIENLISELTDLPYKKEDEFYKSEKYIYIKKFAKKFGLNASNSELTNLQALLSNYNYDFPINKIVEFIENEYWYELDDYVRQKVFYDKPSNLKEAIRRFLDLSDYADTDIQISFGYLLEEYGFWDVIDLEGKVLFNLLESEIEKVEKEIELENFERQLIQGDEPITLEEIDDLNGYEFEDFVKTLFSKMGYQVEQTKLSGDQGADLIVIKLGKKKIIQAKRFKGTVGNKAVQEIMAAIVYIKPKKELWLQITILHLLQLNLPMQIKLN